MESMEAGTVSAKQVADQPLLAPLVVLSIFGNLCGFSDTVWDPAVSEGSNASAWAQQTLTQVQDAIAVIQRFQ